MVCKFFRIGSELLMYKLMLVEDDLEICDILTHFLTKEKKYELTVVHDAQSALDANTKNTFDIILLDIMLPGMDGINLCTQLRRNVFCPIIFISCLDDDHTVINAFRMGGDDYLIKPFKCPVLLARIEANIRRTEYGKNFEEDEIILEDVVINIKHHTVIRKGITKNLSPTEFQILMLFVHNPNVLLYSEKIYQYIWHKPSMGDVRTVKAHVYNLRKKIEENPSEPRYIKTVCNGYIFEK